MKHEWVISVLKDLRSYAEMHGLHALAHKAEETLAVAIAEIDAEENPEATANTAPPRRRDN
jgi:hypothetical protein